MLPHNPDVAIREAIRRVLHNHEKLVAFTTRPYGGKKSGVSAASAPLAGNCSITFDCSKLIVLLLFNVFRS